MDYFKLIGEMQKKFLKNPREGIKKMVEDEKESAKNIRKLGLSFSNLVTLKNFHKEYADIVGKLMKAGVLDVSKLVDHKESVSIIQRLNESMNSVKAYQSGVNETTALRLSRAYASSMEVMWKKLKRIVSLAGLNPDNKHMNIPILLDKLKKLERDYNIDLFFIKKYVDSGLRNFVGHESTVFIPPNIVSFLEIKDNQSQEVMKLTTSEIYKLLVTSTAISSAFFMVDNSAVAARIKPLLKLTDEELMEYSKTGVLTSEMKKKFN